MKTDPNELSHPKITAIALETSNRRNAGDVDTEGGLTKREYFAAIAMQSLVSNWKTAQQIAYQEGGIGTAPKAVAVMAIECADALIAELNKEKKS